MFKPRVYVETTIPSFYHTTRTSAFAISRREWTRRWWEKREDLYERVTSRAVIDELARGRYPSRDAALELIRDLPLLQTSHSISEILATYFRNRLMPADPAGDALHLALASYHRCDFILTWNCRHLANASNTEIRKFVPILDRRIVAFKRRSRTSSPE